MPIARSVPISRVRSRMAIHIVFMMPMTMMATRMTISTHGQPLAAPCSVHIMNEISSSQVVTSSFCPVQSSRLTDLELHPERARVGLHHAVARPAPATVRRRRRDRRDRARASSRSSMIWIAPVASLVAAGTARAGSRWARRRSSCSAGRCPVAIATTRTSMVLLVPRVVGAEMVSASPTLTPSFSAWLSKIRIVPGCARSSSLPLTMLQHLRELRLALDVDAADAEPASSPCRRSPWPSRARAGPRTPSRARLLAHDLQHLLVVGHHRRGLPGA